MLLFLKEAHQSHTKEQNVKAAVLAPFIYLESIFILKTLTEARLAVLALQGLTPGRDLLGAM